MRLMEHFMIKITKAPFVAFITLRRRMSVGAFPTTQGNSTKFTTRVSLLLEMLLRGHQATPMNNL